MGELHSNCIKPKYNENADLPFTHTHSLCCKIRTKYFYKELDPEFMTQVICAEIILSIQRQTICIFISLKIITQRKNVKG